MLLENPLIWLGALLVIGLALIALGRIFVVFGIGVVVLSIGLGIVFWVLGAPEKLRDVPRNVVDFTKRRRKK